MIDTSPDLREQLIDTNVDHIDAVFLTHEHADQTHGMDDLRSVVLHMRKRIPVYFNQSTAKDIMARFSYCFISPEGSDYPPILHRHSIEAGESRTISGKGGDVTMTAFLVQHGQIPALGYRIGNAAYTPDLNDIPRESWGALENLDLWIVDGLRYTQPFQPFQHQRCAVLDRALQAEARRHHQHDGRRRLRGDPAIAARGRGAGL